MKVILTEKVATLGNIGEIVNVTPGHARNYLFPRKLAVLADESKKKQLENQKKSIKKASNCTKCLLLERESRLL